MKYIFLVLLLIASTSAYAAKFPTETLTDNETIVVATIPRAGGTWEATIKATGTFGGGTIKLLHAESSNCSTGAAYIHDLSGAVYSATSQDTVNVHLGIDKDDYTYLCAELTGSTSPEISVTVYDNR